MDDNKEEIQVKLLMRCSQTAYVEGKEGSHSVVNYPQLQLLMFDNYMDI